MFKKAEKSLATINLLIFGPSGSGKTYSALLLAKGIVGDEGKIAVLDTERGSAALYADLVDFDIAPIEPPYKPQKFFDAIDEAEKAGYKCLIIDSLSHVWFSEGGFLELHENLTKDSRNSFAAWGKVTPIYNRLLNRIINCGMHVIVTLRTKTAYEVSKDTDGKVKPKVIGTAPVFREGVEYEFTTVFKLAEDNVATVLKDRTGLFINKAERITVDDGKAIVDWLHGIKRERVRETKPETKPESESESSDKLPEDIQKKLDWINSCNDPKKLDEAARRLARSDLPDAHVSMLLEAITKRIMEV